MKRIEKNHEKIDRTLEILQNPDKHEGSPAFESRLAGALRKQQRATLRFRPAARLAGVAAVLVLLLNVVFFFQWTSFGATLSRSRGIDLLLDTYPLIPAVAGSDYLDQPQYNTPYFNEEDNVVP